MRCKLNVTYAKAEQEQCKQKYITLRTTRVMCHTRNLADITTT